MMGGVDTAVHLADGARLAWFLGRRLSVEAELREQTLNVGYSKSHGALNPPDHNSRRGLPAARSGPLRLLRDA
jgi:hypothetical protein